MRKHLICLILLLFISLTSTILWAESTYSNVSIKVGVGKIISDANKEPNNYISGNFEIHYIHYANIVAMQFKYFDKNPDIITTEISNEITGKDFYIVSVKYGIPLLKFKKANLNAFCGLGLMFRKTNRDKSYSDKSSEDIIGILPIELSFDHRIYKNLGMSLSAFSDLNLTEIIGGLILNLKIDLKL